MACLELVAFLQRNLPTDLFGFVIFRDDEVRLASLFQLIFCPKKQGPFRFEADLLAQLGVCLATGCDHTTNLLVGGGLKDKRCVAP